MGEACPEIGRDFVCCFFHGLDKFSYTNANPIPLKCTDTTILTTFVLIVLLLVCSTLFVSITSCLVFLYHKRREQSFEQKFEQI